MTAYQQVFIKSLSNTKNCREIYCQNNKISRFYGLDECLILNCQNNLFHCIPNLPNCTYLNIDDNPIYNPITIPPKCIEFYCNNKHMKINPYLLYDSHSAKSYNITTNSQNIVYCYKINFPEDIAGMFSPFVHMKNKINIYSTKNIDSIMKQTKITNDEYIIQIQKGGQVANQKIIIY